MRNRRATSVLAAVVMIISGLTLTVAPKVHVVMAQWEQHDLAAQRAATTPLYRNALRTAYTAIEADFEAPIVAFEIGATLETPAVARSAAPSLDPPPAAVSVEGPVEESSRPIDTGPFTIRIPAIGLHQAMVEGVTREHLTAGPGHYPGTAYPGSVGNAVVSGHRTTHTRPFHDLDRLNTGDIILIDSPDATYVYAVERMYVVEPSNVGPLLPSQSALLTLTTCNPKGSAVERLIVVASLVSPPGDHA